MLRLLVIWLGKLLLAVTRLRGGAGSAFPGLVIEKLYPGFIAATARQLVGGSIVVTGTNGKTTTTKLIRGILEASGHQLVSNRAGSNMSRGVASALLEHANWLGQLNGDIGLFEVDEAFTGGVAQKLKPRALVVLNLLRDQLDRYGELDRTAKLIEAGMPHSQSAVLNADDPLVADLAKTSKTKVILFGASPKLRALLPHDEELLKTKRSASVARPDVDKDLTLRTVEIKGNQQQLEIEYQNRFYRGSLQLPGIYNAYNALAAAGAAQAVGIELKRAIDSLAKIEPAFGRTELIELGNKKLQLLLVKNPAGFNQIIRTFLLEAKDQPLLIAINDNFADGRDVSWLWDVDFEQMAGQNHRILTSGIRGYDLAVRLKYAEIKSSTELNLANALASFIQTLPSGATGFIIPTYTAMLSLRSLIAKQTNVKKVWQ